MILKRIVYTACAILAAMSAYAAPFDEDSITSIFSDRVIMPVEGVWQFPAYGAKLLIYRVTATEFDIIALDTPQLNIPPCIKIGHAIATGKPGLYDAEIDKKYLGKKLKLKSCNMVLDATDDRFLCIRPYRTGYSVSFRRLLYRWLKISVIENNERPNNLTGARRVYPMDESYDFPVCL